MRTAITRTLLLAGIALSTAGHTASGQSGSLYRRSLTFLNSGTVTARFDVAGPIAAGSATSVALEFGPDGNVSPLTTEPLPGTVTFVVAKGAQSTPSFTTANAIAGTATPGGITNKSIRMDYTSIGRYVLSITHDTDVGVGTTEAWTITVGSLPTIRGVFAAEAADFTSMTPAPAACGGGTSTPCNCPTCKFCPIKPCLGWKVVGIPEFVWPRPGPGPCPNGLSCPEPWRAEFDPAQFDRIVATFIATPDQRATLERTRDVRFTIDGGEAVGPVMEGGAGDFMQLIQYPKGKPPQVTVLTGDSTLAQFRAEPATVGRTSNGEKFGYGLGGLLLGALGALFGLRRPGGPNTGPEGSNRGRVP